MASRHVPKIFMYLFTGIFIILVSSVFILWLNNKRISITFSMKEPVLLSPENKSTITMLCPYFQWTPSIEPDVHSMGSYKIEIATDSKFKEIIDQDELAATISWYVPNMLFKYGSTYYWRITPLDSNGEAGKSTDVYSFTIIDQPPVYNIPLGTTYSDMKKIIMAAAAKTPSIVQFAEGAHVFDPGTEVDLINLEGVKDLVIEGIGAGADIISKKRVSFLRTQDCSRILFCNMTFDLDPLRYTAGRVIIL